MDEQIHYPEARITDNMVNSMRSTKPWTRILSILGFITTAFTVIMGILMIVAGRLFGQADSPVPAVFLGIVYILMSLLYLFPAIYLFKYSSAVTRFLTSRREDEIESALSYQKSFWKFVGIVALIVSVVAVIGIFAAIIIPLIVGARQGLAAEEQAAGYFPFSIFCQF